MTFTIWGNGGRHEWILRDGETIVRRSDMIFTSGPAARAALLKVLTEMKLI